MKVVSFCTRKRSRDCGTWSGYLLGHDERGSWVFTPAHSTFLGFDGATEVTCEVAQDRNDAGRPSVVLIAAAPGSCTRCWLRLGRPSVRQHLNLEVLMEQVLVRPERPSGIGVLVLAGSSGRIDEGRARLFARHGASALAVRWFGGPGQQPGPWEVPLETFTPALDRLAGECDRIAVVGTSFGAEAALLLGSRAPRISAVVAFAPSPVCWGITPDGSDQPAAHWSVDGASLPFLPLRPDWFPSSRNDPSFEPPAFRDWYATSLAAASPAEMEAASIPVEQIGGSVILVAGGDDQVWPSDTFADAIADRRRRHGRDTTIITHPDAGHRCVLPGENPVTGGQFMLRGGTPEADAELGRRAWPVIAAALALG